MGIRCEGLIKEFGEPPTRVIQGIDLTIDDGEFISISGRSGSGKSTLLYLLSTLDQPSQGRVLIDGRNPDEMSVAELHHFRNTQLGFVFQFHYLLPELSTLENVLLPTRKGHHLGDKTAQAMELLENFGIADKSHKLPSQMSGGEQQRVAIARALIMQPKYLFADEPTGNLDSANGERVMDILKQANRDLGMTLVLVTHEPEFAAMAQREVLLADGLIVESLTPA